MGHTRTPALPETTGPTLERRLASLTRSRRLRANRKPAVIAPLEENQAPSLLGACVGHRPHARGRSRRSATAGFTRELAPKGASEERDSGGRPLSIAGPPPRLPQGRMSVQVAAIQPSLSRTRTGRRCSASAALVPAVSRSPPSGAVRSSVSSRALTGAFWKENPQSVLVPGF